MLKELNIKNYTLIDSLHVEFSLGLNVLTGETGAGKSIIIDVLGYLLGQKANASILRKGAERCEMSGLFDIGQNKPAAQFLQSLSLENDEEYILILRREVDAQGKSKSFINDRPANLSTMARLGEFLVDLHGQHEHQKLLNVAEQRDFLDLYSASWDLREEIRTLYNVWKDFISEKENSQMSEEDRLQKIDLYAFQVKEIDDAKLTANEEEELERLLPQLKNAEKIGIQLEALSQGLYEAEGSVSERLRQAKRSLEILESLGAGIEGSALLLEESSVRVEEILSKVESLKKNIDSDPERLDEVFSRQDQILKLKRKYGSAVSDILAHREKTNAELEKLEGHKASLEGLEEKIVQAYQKLVKSSKILTAARKKTGEKLTSLIEKELKDLGFSKARFSVQFVPEKDEKGKDVPGPTGLESVEFLFSANPGEDLQPLKNVASGGELSRLMLALKKILVDADRVPTLIFDEVDAGVGGSTGHVIGEKLKNLGRSHQVIAVTHLPQIAAYAQNHIAVRKGVVDKRTQTEVETLEKERRVQEIARMLGGIHAASAAPTTVSLKHAQELIELAGKK